MSLLDSWCSITLCTGTYSQTSHFGGVFLLPKDFSQKHSSWDLQTGPWRSGFQKHSTPGFFAQHFLTPALSLCCGLSMGHIFGCRELRANLGFLDK